MGLDTYELVLETEDRFGVAFDEADLAQIFTVGELVAAVRAKLRHAAAGCPCPAAFFRLRDLLREVVGDPGFRARPGEALADRLTAIQRCELWARLPELLGRRPPPLRPAWGEDAVPCGLAAFLAVCGMLTVAALLGGRAGWGLPPALGLGAGGAAAALWLSPGWRARPPWGWETVGDVTRRLAAADARDAGDPGERAVLAEVRDILAEQFAVDPAAAVPNARLVEDLGLC